MCPDCLCSNLQQGFRDFKRYSLYALVVKHENIRIFVAKIIALQLKVEVVDAGNEYVYGDEDKFIVMKQRADSSWKKISWKGLPRKEAHYNARQRVKFGVLTYTKSHLSGVYVSPYRTNVFTSSLVLSMFSFLSS